MQEVEMKYQQRSMKCRQNGTLLIILVAMLLVVLLPVAVGCDPLLVLEFENRTDQVLTIYVDGHRIDDVKPGETIERETVPAVLTRHLIEARNAQGEVVYSKVFTKREISKANYKIVISPSSE
jgi:hypothetical protein